MDVNEYKREHLYPLLDEVVEEIIIPEFKESYNVQRTADLQSSHIKPSAPQFNQVNRINNGQGPANFVGEFLLEKKKLDEKLIHYKKIKNRWTTADSSIKIACISITGLLTISTSIFSGITLLGLAL